MMVWVQSCFKSWSNHGPTIAFHCMLPDHCGTDWHSRARFLACMRLLRGIELDHVQELMEVPAPGACTWGARHGSIPRLGCTESELF